MTCWKPWMAHSKYAQTTLWSNNWCSILCSYQLLITNWDCHRLIWFHTQNKWRNKTKSLPTLLF